eukprot:1248450-Pyramimonas_sp.AAC.1
MGGTSGQPDPGVPIGNGSEALQRGGHPAGGPLHRAGGGRGQGDSASKQTNHNNKHLVLTEKHQRSADT